MKRLLAILLAILIAFPIAMPIKADAGFLKNLGFVGMGGAALYGAADVSFVVVAAVAAVGTAAYPEKAEAVYAKIASHSILGRSFLNAGVKASLKLYPNMLSEALTVKTDALKHLGKNAAAAAQTSASANAPGDPDDPEGEEDVATEVGRKLRAEDMGLDKKDVAELRGRVTLKVDTLKVRIDMIRGELRTSLGKAPTENLGTTPSKMISSLKELATRNGAVKLKIEGTVANSDLMKMLSSRYGGRLASEGANEYIEFILTGK